MISELRPNTFTQYRQVMENSICQYKPFVGVKLKKLTPPLLQSYINERVKDGLSPNSIRKHYCIIRKCLDYAVRLDMIPYNPSDRVELPKKKKYQGAKVFTPDQFQELLDLFHDDPLETATMRTYLLEIQKQQAENKRLGGMSTLMPVP